MLRPAGKHREHVQGRKEYSESRAAFEEEPASKVDLVEVGWVGNAMYRHNVCACLQARTANAFAAESTAAAAAAQKEVASLSQNVSRVLERGTAAATLLMPLYSSSAQDMHSTAHCPHSEHTA